MGTKPGHTFPSPLGSKPGCYILKVLRDNLQVAQNQQKQYVDQHRMERQFQVNGLVYLSLKPYKKTTIKGKGLEKLKPIFYGPYKVIRKVGEVAY